MIEVKFVRSDWTNRKSGYGQTGKPMAGFLLRLPSRRKSNVEFMFMLMIGEGFLIRQWITVTRFKLPLFPSSPFWGPSCKRWHKTKGKCEVQPRTGGEPIFSLLPLQTTRKCTFAWTSVRSWSANKGLIQVLQWLKSTAKTPRLPGVLTAGCDIHHGRQSSPCREWARVPAMLLFLKSPRGVCSLSVKTVLLT